MCGIAGFLLRQPRLDEDALRDLASRMAETLKHRGPDGGEVWSDAGAGISLGHRRLAIQDLSEAGRQPMTSACERYVITYNGEIYDFRALRCELEDRGRRFRGHSDTEVLLAAISEWGLERAIARCHGMFAFALWDRRKRTLTLARDRAGQKPLYYGWCGDAFLFGSELKALRSHPAFEAGIDRDALGLLLRYGWIPGPHSIYQGVGKLPPGTLLRIVASSTPATASPRPYWSAHEVAKRGEAEPFRGSLAEATDALDGVLHEAVSGRMIADVGLGALLSGGIDSSLVVALMQKLSERRVKTFSIGFREPRHDEAPYARAVAQHLGTDHTELYVEPRDGLDVIPSLPSIYDEPFADASQIPTLLVSRLARSEVTVALSGDGGDELFAGYNRYDRCLRSWARFRRTPAALRRPLARGLDALANAGWNLLGPRASASAAPLPRWRRLPAKLKKTARDLPAADPADLLLRMGAHCGPASDLVYGAAALGNAVADSGQRPQGSEPLQSLMELDFASYLPDAVLVKVDRASMAVSLEVRSPFLDHRVVELAWSLPLAHRVGAGGGKLVVRELLARHLPRELFERRKQGFTAPVGEWLRGPLRPWAEDLLEPGRLGRQGLLRPRAVERVWRQHLCGWRNHDNLLWSLLMFQAWHEARRVPGS
jgi:asparagine synthase (glutamine-hydrolysing)